MSQPHLKLVSFAICPYVQRARIVLQHKNIDYELEFIDLDAPPEWFLDISPLGKVPVLLADDKPVFESMVICEYLDEITTGSLHPADPFEKAQNRAWIEFGNDVLSNTYAWFTTDDELRYKQLRATLTDRFEILEEQLQHSPYFNGEEFSMVDAVFAPLFRSYEVAKQFHSIDFFDETPNVVRWWNTLLAHPAVKLSAPDTYMDEMASYLKNKDSVFSKSRSDA